MLQQLLKKTLLPLILVCMVICCKAQGEFKDYFQYNALATKWSKELYMSIGIPKGFYVGTLDVIKDNPLRSPDSLSIKAEEAPGGVVFSANKDIMIFYPNIELLLWPYKEKIITMEYQKGIMSLCKYLENSLGTPANHQIMTHTNLCGKADSIIISNQNINTKNFYGYTKVTSIYLKKEHYLPLYFRIFFNKSSEIDSTKIMKSLLHSVKYINTEDIEKLKDSLTNFSIEKDKQAFFPPVNMKEDSPKAYDIEINVKKTNLPIFQDTISIEKVELYKDFIKIVPEYRKQTVSISRKCEHFEECMELLEFALLKNYWAIIKTCPSTQNESTLVSIKLWKR